uniref:Ig-like domain-containing protein n=1 Tax=Lates calcarifer TaxID=8187 RepID=A0A4W6CW41_LATCA
MCIRFHLISAQMTEVKFSSSVRQDTRFISVKTGDNLTLHCFREDDVASRYYWYKQTLGQKLRLISSFYKFDKNGTFHDEFKKDTRLTLDTGTTYYCASSYSYKFVFAEGTTVSVKDLGLNIQALGESLSSRCCHLRPVISPGISLTTVEGGSLVLVYFLSGALAFTTILSVLLTFLICFINKRDSCKCAGSVAANFFLSLIVYTQLSTALQLEHF